MKLITFQHKDILNQLNNGKYICNKISKYQSFTPLSYNILRNRLIDKIGSCENPIFAWAQVIPGKELKVDSKTIGRALEMTGFNFEHYLIFELDVDDKYVDIQDFYNFVDMRCEEEGIDCYYNSFDEFPIDKVFTIDYEYELQATIPMIKLEWVKSIYEFKNTNRNDVEIIKIK